MDKWIALLIVMIGFLLSSITYAAASSGMTLTATDFENKKTIPDKYTCDGENVSPELKWTSTYPQGAESLVLVVADQDALGGTFYHWVVYNIPLTMQSFPKGMTELPANATLAKNSWGKNEYNGPCPPQGETHHYVFTLYATDNKLSLPGDADGKTVLDAISNHVIGASEIIGIYSRK